MIIYTDGACSGNPGPGGFAVVVLNNQENYINSYSEYCADTTNNREEMKAILWTCIKYGKPAAAGSEIPVVYSDSAYAVNVFTTWMFSWKKKNDWIKSNNKAPENLDLIVPFYNLWEKGYRINLQHIKGHNNNKWNDMANDLAVQTYQEH